MTHALIIGASRGIGLEFAKQYRADKVNVTATARSEEGLSALKALGCNALKLDVNDINDISGLGWQLEGSAFDVVVINAGVYGPKTSGLDAPTQDEFDTVMHTHALAAMRLIPQIAPLLSKSAKLAVISSRMGSIAERSSPNGWLYRASKAALNSVLKDASIALASQGATCVSFHPGWVRTDMGGAGADISPEQSVSGMRATLAKLSAKDNGRFLNYDGSAINW
jgi:NAD(P)-dependent dehydrogenase (short-subunit alcohol dehydrogenase family)